MQFLILAYAYTCSSAEVFPTLVKNHFNSLDFILQCLAICHRDLCNFPFLFSGNKSFCFRSNQPLSIIFDVMFTLFPAVLAGVYVVTCSSVI